MRIHHLSDLHDDRTPYRPVPAEVVGCDVVVLTGDIGKGSGGIEWARRHYPNTEVIYVPGNHEFYGLDLDDALAEMRAAAKRTGVHLLDNDEVTLRDRSGQEVRFLGATLWTDFELFGRKERDYMMWQGERGINDYRLITLQGRRLTPASSIELHRRSVSWLTEALEQRAERQVVLTHHLPSMRSVSERFQHSDLSACFASNLDPLVAQCDLWLHGHTHDSMDYLLGKTRVVCNPRGYQYRSGAFENDSFDPMLVIEV